MKIITGDVREVLPTLPSDSFDCCVTSPPYFGLRDYGVNGQIGLEATLDAYVAELVAVFQEVWRVLKPTGTFWLNIGDSYAASRSYQVSQTKHQVHDYGKSNAQKVPEGLKAKDLMMVPARLALALQADGWWVRSEIIWHKPNPMPESVTDRPTSAHEKVYMLTKSAQYYFNAEAVRENAEERKFSNWADRKTTEPIWRGDPGHSAHVTRTATLASKPGRNIRNVWTITPKPFKGAHFATFPPDLVERCLKAGCPPGGSVIDPFGGAGTTLLVADQLGMDATLIELNPTYVELAWDRVYGHVLGA